MTEQEFMNKWSREDIIGIWAMDSDHLYWARSYKMPRNELIKISLDFLSIPGISEYGSSGSKARQVTRYTDMEGNVM